jgi:hypothetical protein
MTRFKRARPALVVAVVTLVAAVAGTALAGSGPDANTAGAAKTAKKALKKAKKANKKAKNAQTAADSAQTAADSAQTAANSAQDSANSAQATADNSLQNPVRRVVAISPSTDGADQTRDVTASCPAGEKAIAGGGMWTGLDGVPTGFNILQGSRPVPSTAGTGPTTGWQATGKTDSADVRQLRAYAICVPV